MRGLEPDVGVVAHELGRVLEVRVAARDVGVDVVPDHVLVHPQAAVAQDVVGPHEEVVDPRGGREREVRPVVEGVHARQPAGERPHY